MINSLDDAWEWYEAVDRLAHNMGRVATKYWDREELTVLLESDNHLRHRTSAQIKDDVDRVLGDLEDLAVLILFTVLEAEVRGFASIDAERLRQRTTHPAMRSAVKNLEEAIRQGSFAKVTKSYRQMDVDLTAQVDQIRGFRNWVAHGRRGTAKNQSNPDDAIARMRRYIEKLKGLVTAPEGTDPAVAGG